VSPLDVWNLIPKDAVILDPSDEGHVYDPSSPAFDITYPSTQVADRFAGFYLIDNGEPPEKIPASDLHTFQRYADLRGIPVVIKPHAKWFKGKGVEP
jgi:hypothetical protein